MPAIQPIPQRPMDPASREATELLAMHRKKTDSRSRKPAAWDPPTRKGSVPGENAGTRKA